MLMRERNILLDPNWQQYSFQFNLEIFISLSFVLKNITPWINGKEKKDKKINFNQNQKVKDKNVLQRKMEEK